MTKGSRYEKVGLDERTCVVDGRSLEIQDHHKHMKLLLPLISKATVVIYEEDNLLRW